VEREVTKRAEGIPAGLGAILTAHGLPVSEQAAILATSLLSIGRLKGLVDAIDMAAAVPGDTAEIGVANGGTSRLIALLNRGRRHWACDTFEGLVDVCEHDTLTNGQFHNPAVKVRAVLHGLPTVRMVGGYFPKSAGPAMKRERFSLVHIDVDTYLSIKGCFEFFSSRMSPGGIVVLDDVLERGCVGAIKAFEELKRENTGSWTVVRADMPPQAVVRFK